MQTQTSTQPAAATPLELIRTEPGAQQATTARPMPDPMATVSITIQRDTIIMTARLLMGGTRTVMRTWQRKGHAAWSSRDPDFIAAEERIGIELAEFIDAIDLPSKVADMLPRPPAIKAVSHG